jgi:hypothetical protein
MAVLVTAIQWMAGSCPSIDPARLRGGELAIRRCVAAVAFAPIPAVCGDRDRTDGVGHCRSFTHAALTVLFENNMVARTIHGMIPLGGRLEEVRK